MQISNEGLLFITREEGVRLNRYLDSVGVPTIGIGTTAADLGHPVPTTCTLAQAEQWLRDGIARTYSAPLNRLIAEGKIHPTQHQYDALCSISYNEGPGILEDVGTWQMARDLAAGNMTAVGDDFMRYTMAGGRPILAGRRAREQAYYRTPDPKPAPPPDPHHYLWFDSTVRDLGGDRKGSEREIVKEYDEKRDHHPHIHEPRLGVLRRDMAYLAGRLVGFLEHNDPDNEKYHRKFRHDGLLKRSKGEHVA
jgi:lysozyme